MRRNRKSRFDTSPAATSANPAPSVQKEPELVSEAPSNAADERFRGLSGDAEFQRKAGIGGDEKRGEIISIVPNFKPSDFLIVIDFYAIVISMIFSQVLKAKFEIIYNVCKFDDDQRKVVSEHLCPVVEKYFPVDWLPYLPEIKLGFCLVGITTSKFQQCMEAVKAMTIEIEKENARKTAA